MRCATKPVLPPCVIESPTAQMENPATREATGTITLAATAATAITFLMLILISLSVLALAGVLN